MREGVPLEQFDELLKIFDEGFDLCEQYDMIPHQYGDEVLYQSEMHFLQVVGKKKDLTITAIAQILKKTTSACSQTMSKLKKKGLLIQHRNGNNNREYYLELTERGRNVFLAHEKLDNKCLNRTKKALSHFSEKELDTYIAIQKCMNHTFKLDIEENVPLANLDDLSS